MISLNIYIAKDGDKPLHEAAWYDDIEQAQELIQQGMSVNCRNYDEETPLIIAARAESYGVATEILCVTNVKMKKNGERISNWKRRCKK